MNAVSDCAWFMRQIFGIWNICGGSIFAIPYTKKLLLHCVLFLERNKYSLYIALSIQHLISKSRFEIVKCVYGGNSTTESYNFHSINHNWEGFNRQLSLYILFPLDDVVNILDLDLELTINKGGYKALKFNETWIFSNKCSQLFLVRKNALIFVTFSTKRLVIIFLKD